MSILDDIETLFNETNKASRNIDKLLKTGYLTDKQTETFFDAKLALVDSDFATFWEIIKKSDYAWLCEFYL